MKFSKNQIVGFTSKLSNFEIVNSEFTRCKCYILATGDNVNGSDITYEAVKKAMERGEFYNKPVVAHLYQDPDDNNKWRVGGHDSKWVITRDSIEIINETIPFGTIPESSDLKLEEVLEADGETINTYLTCQLILWTGRFNIMDAAYSDDIYFNQSCEISINEYHYKNNGVLAIDDFTFSAICLLNKSSDSSKNIRPCFSSCKVEKIKSFSIDESSFKKNFELMLNKIKQFESDGTAVLPVQDNEKTKNKKGATNMELEKFISLLSEFKCEGTDSLKYELLSADGNNVYMLDRENGYKIFSVKYVMSDNDPVINWTTKTEGDIAFTEKNEDAESHLTMIYNEINDALSKKYKEDYSKIIEDRLQEYTKEYEGRYDELQAEFDTLKDSYSVAKEQLMKYKEIEMEEAKQRHIDAVKETLDKFEKKMGKHPEFIYYKAKMDKPENIDLKKLEDDLTMMIGEISMSDNNTKSKAYSYNPTSTSVKKYGTENDLKSRYGHLFDGFIN